MRVLRGTSIAVVLLLFTLFPLGCGPGCGGTDWNYKNSGTFEIGNATVRGMTLWLSEDKSTVVLEVGKNQLTITPRWVLTGREIVVVFKHKGEVDLNLVGFRIDSERFREEDIPGVKEENRYPWYRYYSTREGSTEREELALPLVLGSKTALGFLPGVVDDPPQRFHFLFNVSGDGQSYTIEFSAKRKT